MSVLGAIFDAARRLLSSKETSACLQQEDRPIWEHPFFEILAPANFLGTGSVKICSKLKFDCSRFKRLIS